MEAPENCPPDGTRKAPPAALRPSNPPAESGRARAAPPPPARTSRAATVTPRSRASAHARRAYGLQRPALLTQMGLASATSPPPRLRSTAGHKRKCGSAPRQPTQGRRERRPRPQRASGPPQAPPQPPSSCFGAPRGGAWEERHPRPAGRPRPRGRTLPSFPDCRARPIRSARAMRGWGLPPRRERGPAQDFLLVGAAPPRVYLG